VAWRHGGVPAQENGMLVLDPGRCQMVCVHDPV